MHTLIENLLADRDRLLEEIYQLQTKVADQERCLGLAAQMIETMEAGR
jgi:hypothetical protein